MRFDAAIFVKQSWPPPEKSDVGCHNCAASCTDSEVLELDHSQAAQLE